MLKSRRRRRGEHGQMVVLFALSVTLLMVLAALVIDVGFLRTDSAQLRNALDAGVLAGAYDLPATHANYTTPQTAAINTAKASFSRIGTPDVPDPVPSFGCIISYDPVTNLPHFADMPTVCNVAINSIWTCEGTICWAPCDPVAITTDTCNTIKLTGTATRRYSFAPVVAINSGSTGSVMSAACRGPCGVNLPLDAVLSIDRTLSMQNSGSIPNLKLAATAVLQAYDPALQRVALGLAGPSLTSATGVTCGNSPNVDVNAVANPYTNPAYVSDNSAATVSGGATSLTINTPASSDGDLMIAGITVAGGTNTTIPTPPSGWTLITRTDNGTNVGLATYYHVATASEPSSYKWTFGSSAKASGGIIDYTGVNPSTPIDTTGTGGTGNSAAVTAPSVTTTLANDIVVGFFATAANATFTKPTGTPTTTEEFDQRIGTTSGPATEGIDFAVASAGVTGSKTATASSSGQWVAQMIALRPAIEAYGKDPTVDLAKWIPIGFTGTDTGSPAPAYNENYVDVTTLDANHLPTPVQSSHLVSAINCFNNSSAAPATTLATPLNMATYYLTHSARSNAKKGIILETDGFPQYGSEGSIADFTCQAAYDAAQSAKDAGIEIFTIGYGISTTQKCNDGNNPYPSTSWNGKYVIDLLAQMATGPVLGTTSCTSAENTDDDHFFCQPTGTDLSSVFRQVAVALASGTRLVQLYPIPVVTGVSPATGGSKLGGTSVTISGQYFTGATSVTFGGAGAAFTVTSSSSITAIAPAGAANSTVDVIVRTQGGVSPVVPADQYTYGP